VTYVQALLATMHAGCVAVPLALSHPLSELDFFLRDSRPRVLLLEPSLDAKGEFSKLARALGIHVMTTTEGLSATSGQQYSSPARVDADAGALLVYTSGTTGRPKGVLATHRSLQHQVTDLVSAWQWSRADRILHFLPLHHVHGIVNKLLCALWAGATVEFCAAFNAAETWGRLAAAARGDAPPLTLLMGVPTVYVKLIEAFEKLGSKEREEAAAGARACRVHVCGSAPLPVSVLSAWRQITGHTLLERYGMSEFGMALSNPLDPIEERMPGFVGQPLPSAQVRLADEATGLPLTAGNPGPGELQVRGPIVFREVSCL
jgi:malonyl-CoA/methylmalonyl-CoA synthetase